MPCGIELRFPSNGKGVGWNYERTAAIQRQLLKGGEQPTLVPKNT